MKKLIILFLLIANIGYSQEVPTSGFLLPRKTTVERQAFPVNTARGIIVYDTDTESSWTYNGTAWNEVRTEDQLLSIDGDSLRLEDGGAVALDSLVDGDAWGVDGEDVNGLIRRQGNVGIGSNTVTPTATLDVSGTFRNRNGGQFVVQGGQDGGTGRGIHMWTNTDTNWGIYMSTSGAGKSLSGGTAPAGAGFDAHAIRFRAGNSDIQGFVFENSAGTLLSSIRGSDGLSYFRGNVGIGTSSPLANLHINGGNSAGIVISDQANSGDNLRLALYHGGATGKGMGFTWNDAEGVDGGLVLQSLSNTGGFVANRYFFGRDGNLGIGTAAPANRLTVNAEINHDNSFNYGEAQQTIFDPNNNGGNIPNGTRDILHLVREGVVGQAFGNKASFALGRYENNGYFSRSQLDIKLTDNSFDLHRTVMSLRSNGNVGIGTTSPTEKLEVNGTIKVTAINFTNLPVYADESAATTGGLTTGDLYRTNTGEIRIKL
ncbi:hypothetical protein N9H19_00825 [Flavobacteriales bacterium]|nr:hypothetical protein [Flavobacteriales bacterium]